MWRDLRAWGDPCGRKRMAQLMREAGLQGHWRRRRLPGNAGARSMSAIAPNLFDR
jgi:hypothetical protein